LSGAAGDAAVHRSPGRVSPARDGLARSVQVRLARHARDIGVDPNLVLTRYGVERFLYRLSRSPHAERFVLKGGLLLLAWLGETLRPTTDADFLGFGDLSDERLAATVREVCDQAVAPDGMVYDAESVTIESIREEDAYGGRRVRLRAQLGAARIGLQLDVGIGDAMTPGPEWLDYPTLLGDPGPRLRSYPRQSVVAEKVHAMALLGARNSRMKDFFDVLACCAKGASTTRCWPVHWPPPLRAAPPRSRRACPPESARRSRRTLSNSRNGAPSCNATGSMRLRSTTSSPS